MTAGSSSTVGKLRVSVDINACCGYGACKDICPEVFQLERGLVVLTTEIVPEGLEAKAQDAADSCPQFAIVIEPVEE